MVAKNNNVEVYAQGFYNDSYKNAIPGQVLSQGVTSVSESIKSEFYLISSTQRQGFANP